MKCNLAQTKDTNVIEHKTGEACLIAKLMTDVEEALDIDGAPCYAQQYLLHKGLKLFGNEGRVAAKKELDQLYRRLCYKPISIADLSESELKKAQAAMLLLTEKSNGDKKG